MTWDGYLREFHTTRPGVTESVLCHSTSRSANANPYDWLAAAVPDDATVLDLGAGNAPMWPLLAARTRYVGLDTSPAELAAAHSRGAGPLVRATAAAIPLQDRSVDAVVCSMSLQVLTPLPAVLAEVTRVLAPGGSLVATVPARAPLRPLDLPIVAGLQAILGRRLTYPNDHALAQLSRHLNRVGLRPIDDQCRCFTRRLRTRADADQLLASLYLPDLPTARYRRAGRYLRFLARIHREVPIPIRRITADTA